VGRDRLGEKPVLYALVPEGLLLASEVKALLQWPSLPRDLDRGALCSYLNVMYVPAPRTIFRAIRKLEPGQYMVFEDGRVTIHPYWVAVANPTLNAAEPRLAEELPALLREAVRSRMVADVPVGVFLSGGIDSSAVTAFAAGLSTDRVRTFTVAFGDQIDERPRARAVADRYGTQHVELVVEECLEEQFERIYGYMDEPFADSSVVPTNAIAHAAREHVKVILSGDGGDELFAGYPDYVDQKYRSGGRLRTAVLKYLNRFVIRTLQWDPVGSHCVGRSERALASWHDVRSVFREREVSRLTGSSCDTQRLFADRLSERAGLDSLSTAFLYDLRFYLPDDLLKKVDMASMQASLECRAPLLDHRLVEWALKMPVGLKLSNDQPKAFLRRALAKHLPATVVAAPKQGFGAPLSAWIRGPLRNVIMDLTAPGGRASAYLDCAAIAAVRNAESVAQPGDDYRVFQQLWSLAIFEYWLRRYT
jgi:asparagine synthase (glutamine-hydrolysing)